MNNGWIQTYTGRKVYPLKITPEDIDPADIAHALALKCRFTGHCGRFYSVAQHSVLVSQHVPPSYQREALLHDAAEAYLPDVASPLKAGLMWNIDGNQTTFKTVEDNIMDAVCVRFATRLKLYWPESIKRMDARMLATEKRDLMVLRNDTDWGMIPEHHQPFEHFEVHPWNWVEAERTFMHAFTEMGLK